MSKTYWKKRKQSESYSSMCKIKFSQCVIDITVCVCVYVCTVWRFLASTLVSGLVLAWFSVVLDASLLQALVFWILSQVGFFVLFFWAELQFLAHLLTKSSTWRTELQAKESWMFSRQNQKPNDLVMCVRWDKNQGVLLLRLNSRHLTLFIVYAVQTHFICDSVFLNKSWITTL